MSPLRKKKLESSIMREMAQLIFSQQGKDDNIQFVSVVKVDLYKDFSLLKVYLSFFGSEKSNELSFQGILKKTKYFQSAVSNNLSLRLTPRLIFYKEAVNEAWEAVDEL